MSLLWISEQRAIITVHGIHLSVFIVETHCVYSAVRTESLNIIRINLRTWCMHAGNLPTCSTNKMFPIYSVVTLLLWGVMCISRCCIPNAMGRGELSYMAPLGSENISAPYFKQCLFGAGGGGVLPPRQSNTTPPSPKTEITNILFYIWILHQ